MGSDITSYIQIFVDADRNVTLFKRACDILFFLATNIWFVDAYEAKKFKFKSTGVSNDFRY